MSPSDDDLVLEWLRRRENVRDPAIFVASLRADLSAMSPSRVAACFELVAAATDAGLRDHAHLLVGLAVAIEDEALRTKKREAGVLGALEGRFAARDMLVREGEDEEEATGQVPLTQLLGRPVTLGERKSLARGRERAVLDRVLRDPSSDVIRLLLDNPSIRTADVVRLVATRPGKPSVLREVFVSLRWVLLEEVRVALVKNPRTPTDLSLAFVRTISRAQLPEIGSLGDLPASLRETARWLAARPPLH